MGMEPRPISDAFLGCFDKEHQQQQQQQQPILSSRPYKKRLSEDQVKFLEMSFSFEKKLEPQRKVQLAYDLGLHPRQVAIWYQNKRARWKTQRLELDYNALKTQLESIVTEKRKLEKEVSRLTVELDHAKEIIRKSCGMEIMGSSAAESGEALMVITDQEAEEEEEEEEEEDVEDGGGCGGGGLVSHHGGTGGVKVEGGGGGGGAGGGSGGNIMEDLYACLVGFDAGHAHGKLHCFDLF